MFDRLFGDLKGGKKSSAPPRIPRHSGGWAALRKRLTTETGLRILDVGATSSSNINYLTSLGQSVYMADFVREAWSGEWQTGVDSDGKPVWNDEDFAVKALDFAGRHFDIVLLWTALDYLPDPFVPKVIERLHAAVPEGGQLLALFHTKKDSPDNEYCRYHLRENDEIDVESLDGHPIQRAFTNRSIQTLFNDWAGFKQFLAKDGVSEVLITR